MSPELVKIIRRKAALRELYGIIALIDYLQTEEGRKITYLHSSTVGGALLDRSQYTTEAEIARAVAHLGEISFGNKTKTRTPLEDVINFFPPDWEKLSLAQLQTFDLLCADFHLLATGARCEFKLILSGLTLGSN